VPSDLRIALPNRPGALASALDSLARQGIRVESACGDLRPGERWGYLHLLVEDGDRARVILERDKIEVISQHQVEVINVETGVGALLELLRSFLDRGENVDVIYMTAGSKWVVGTESMRNEIPGVRVSDTDP
jgi:hypothetical protein